MPNEFPALLVSRRRRETGAGWAGARSWLGGAPRLGAIGWPRSSKGTPLHFVAQLDLSDIAAVSGATSLPATGSLAFFISPDSPVVFVPQATSTPTLPPADTPDLGDAGASEAWRTDLSGRPLFPYWPVDFTKLDVTPPPGDDYDEAYDAFVAAQIAAVETHFPRREYHLSPEQAFAGPPIPDWWQTAIHYAAYLEKAVRGAPGAVKRDEDMLDYTQKKLAEARAQGGDVKKAEAAVAMYQSKLAKLHELEPVLRAFAEQVARFAEGRDPWALMTADDMAGLAALWARNREFDRFHSNSGNFPIDYLKKEMFKALPPLASDEFAAFPARVRDLVSEKRAPRPQWWFMAVHYVKRLQEAVRLGVPNASAFRQKNLAAYRKRLDELQPKESRGIFGRKSAPKGNDVVAIEASIAKTEAELVDVRRLAPVFEAFVREVAAWAEGRDPWTLMADADVEELKTRMKRAKEEFGAFASYLAPARINDLEALTLRTMATADERGYAALPESVRAFINRNCLLPSGSWHQMFGRGVEIQGASSAMREEGYVLLLQLVADDMMEWSFGDNGAYQFWISPSDLARRNWSGVKMTFECH